MLSALEARTVLSEEIIGFPLWLCRATQPLMNAEAKD